MAKDEVNSNNDIVSKECIFTTIVSEASGLYSLLITISTGIFGSTLLFLNQIAPNPTKLSLVFLFVGWCSLGVSIALCAIVRWKNLESGRMALEGKYDRSCQIDKPNRCCTVVAIITLILGMVLVGCFGAINITNKVNNIERIEKMNSEKEKTNQPQEEEITKHSIPYGSVSESQQEELSTEDSSQGEGSKESESGE